jgi:hypothetical protein
MIYVPQALEATARRWVSTYQEVWQLIEKISQTCFERFLRGKEKLYEQRKAKTGPRRSHG